MQELLSGFRKMMKNNLIFISIIIFFWSVLVGASLSIDLKIPIAKIEKSIKKLKLGDNVVVSPIIGVSDEMTQSEIFKLESGSDIVGYVYVSRLNSCRADGCSSVQSNNGGDFEFFDYFLITDTSGKVIQVKVYNYQATHGHQVMSKGWLKQFVGYSGSHALRYGLDIQAISGATISAKAITNDIQRAEKLIAGIIGKK